MMDEIRLKRKLTTVVLLILVSTIAFYTIKIGDPLFGGLLLAFPIGIFFLTRPVLTALMVPMAYFSKLMIPGMPGSFTLNYMFQAVLIAWWIFAASMHRIERRPLNMTDKMVLGYALTILATMAVRGFGIRLMGSMSYGGMAYFYIFLWIGFYFACRHISVLEKHVNRFLLGLCFASFIPVLLMVLVFYKPGLHSSISKFTTTAFDYLGTAIQTGEAGKARWGAATVFSSCVMYYALVTPFKTLVRTKRVLLLLIAGFATLVSGFRSSFIVFLMTVFLWTFLKSKNKIVTLSLLGATALIVWGLAFLFVDALPANIQRTVSLLPGVKTYGEDARLAQQSISWRMDVWAYAITRIPEYLMVGRGLVTDVSAAAWMQESYYVSPEFAWMVSNYHSGPLSIILTFGLSGAITWFGFLFTSVHRGITALRRYRKYQELYAYNLLKFSSMILAISILEYIFLNGNVVASFPLFMVWIVVLSWCIRYLKYYDLNQV